MELKFYNLLFHRAKYGTWVYDAKSNFVFQFENKYDEKGNLIDGVTELQEQVIFSLNALYNEPILTLNLSVDKDDECMILNDNIPFIMIRGWGNLTGIGGYNFDSEKASKIQDNFRDWIIYKLTKNQQ